jgi:hypothetical protein
MREYAKRLSKSENTVRKLTDDDLLAYGDKIVSTTMIPAIWHQKTGHTFTRTAALKARDQGRIAPMGHNRTTLFWWREEIEQAAPPKGSIKRGRPSKSEETSPTN